MTRADHTRPAGLPETVDVRGVTIRLDWDGYHAVTRGYFPLSLSGFRSYSGLATAEAAALEACAAAVDRSAAEILRAVQECRRVSPARPFETSLARFVRFAGPAERAIEAGLFARKELRGDLWGYAVRVLEMVQGLPELHPQPGERWTERECSQRMERLRVYIATTRAAIAGDVSELLSMPGPALVAYAALRPGNAAEPCFALPPAIMPERVAGECSTKSSGGRDGTGQTEFRLL